MRGGSNCRFRVPTSSPALRAQTEAACPCDARHTTRQGRGTQARTRHSILNFSQESSAVTMNDEFPNFFFAGHAAYPTAHAHTVSDEPQMTTEQCPHGYTAHGTRAPTVRDVATCRMVQNRLTRTMVRARSFSLHDHVRTLRVLHAMRLSLHSQIVKDSQHHLADEQVVIVEGCLDEHVAAANGSTGKQVVRRQNEGNQRWT